MSLKNNSTRFLVGKQLLSTIEEIQTPLISILVNAIHSIDIDE
jgi:hypothetical protein